MTVYDADWVCPATAAPIASGSIAVANGRIAAIGPSSDVPGSARVALPGCAIVPGFVNVHTHLELTILRGFLENSGFIDWIRDLTRAKYQRLDRAAMKVSAQLGALEMLAAGVTAVGEVMDIGTGSEAMTEFDLQGIAYQEVFGPSEAAAAASLQGLRDKIGVLRKSETESRRVGVSPHAPYTVSKALFQGTRDFARAELLPLSTHIAESREETLFVRDGAGAFADNHRSRGIDVTPRQCLPVSYLESIGMLGPEVLLVHALEIDDRDCDIVRDAGSPVAHCPKSNAKLAHRTARLTDLLERGVTVGLGTDSVSSNNVVDMFEEMRTAVFQQRARTGNIQCLSAAAAFRMATIDGARALGLDALLGSLEPGKRADFAVVDLQRPATWPVYDPIETMVYSASRSDVRSTFIGGREASIDRQDVLAEAAAVARRLR